MNEKRSYDALVVGAGVSGLVAAAYLARAGKRVVVVEARGEIGGMSQGEPLGHGFSAPSVAHALHALDPRVVKELKLARLGLKFAMRDMPLVGLNRHGKHLMLTRDVAATMRSIAVHSRTDAEIWPKFRSDLFDLGRAMRSLWWEPGECPPAERLSYLARTSWAAWLNSQFESDTLKATIGFDANAMSPLEPGSAILLVWRAAQEMCGLQGATAFPAGGPAALARVIGAAAQGLSVEILTGERVQEIAVEHGTVSGVHLQSGEFVGAPLVLSSLGRRRTLLSLSKGVGTGIAERAALARSLPPIASAKILLALDALPAIGGVAIPKTARFILAERPDSYVAAHAAARAGEIPGELIMEVVLASAADATLAPAGSHLMSVLVQPLPREIAGGWNTNKVTLAARVVATLETFFPGIARCVVAAEALTPETLHDRYGLEVERFDATSLLARWPKRVLTAIKGLYLCGAEPAAAVSGRAGRIAAMFALKGEER